MELRAAFLLLVPLAAGCDVKTTSNLAAMAPSRAPAGVPPARTPPTVAQNLAEVEKQLQEQPDDINLQKTKAILLRVQANTMLNVPASRSKAYALFEESGLLWRKVKAESPELSKQDQAAYSSAIYDLACALSLKQELTPAMAALRESVEAGFSKIEHLKQDADLNNLRNLPDYKALLEEIPKLKFAAAKKMISDAALFPFEFSLPNPKGEIVSSKDFRGKVLMVDIWGTWCQPCRIEIPHFVDLHQRFHGKGLEIVGINYELDDDPAAVKKLIADFMVQNSVPYACVIGDEKTQSQIVGLEGYPTTLFIDRQGRVRAKVVGFDEEDADMLQAMVEVLLAEAETAGQ